MKRTLVLALTFVSGLMLSGVAFAAEPDYAEWSRLLEAYYSPANGMDYAALKQDDMGALNGIAESLSNVDVASLERSEQLAFWINLYNVSTVRLICDNYPVKSIRDLSTDPLSRMNVFKKAMVAQGGQNLSLDDIENVKIRDAFKDPRIHFALNCAARSCPPMRSRAFTGAGIDAQLDEQTRAFMNTARVERSGSKAKVSVTKIMEWYKEDFAKWGGGAEAFTKKYLDGDKAKQVAGVKISISYAEYDWSLNDWKR